MKLHDLRPNPGAHTAKTRVGRGIAAGKGKTAGRGTKGQKARAGGSIPPWFEGGQTPLHIRIPKLRGFKNRFKIEYEVVNLGAINQLVELGELGIGDASGSTSSARREPVTVNQEILRAAGLVSTLARPLKVLGHGEITAPLFVVADAFSKSAIGKIQAAGGTAQQLETPKSRMAALMGSSDEAEPQAPAPKTTAAAPRSAAKSEATAPAKAAAKTTGKTTSKAEPAEKSAPAAKGAAARAAVAAPEPAAPVEPEASTSDAAAEATSDPDAAVATEGSADAPASDSAGADVAPAPARRSRAKGASSEADGGAA